MSPRKDKSAPSDPRLTLLTLGRALVVRTDDASEAPLLELGKPLALLTYLSCSPRRAASRAHLIDLLWADQEPDAAKHSLRQTLWYLRRELGENIVSSGGDSVSLPSHLRSDREQFLSAAERGEVAQACALYTGDFLPGFAAPGGAEFEKWVDVERLRLRSLFIRSAESHTRELLSSARSREAIILARRVRDGDPANQSGWRLLLESLVASNDAIGSAAEADALEQLLQRDGVDTEQSTRAMIRVARQTPIQNDDASRSAPSTLVSELVGREREFSAVLRAWESARVGAAKHVHIVASAGLGKTRLLTEVAARMRSYRARVVVARATIAARDVPYALVSDIAAQLAGLGGARGISTGAAGVLVAMNPSLSSSFVSAPDASVGEEALRRRILALRELLDAIAENSPFALLIDDLHWADAMSLQSIAGILDQLETTRVLIVTTCRPTVEIVHLAPSSERIELRPLTDVQTGELLASLGAVPSEPWAQRLPAALARSSGGAPLLILETLQLLLDRGLLTREGGQWSGNDPRTLFDTLDAGGALRQRIAALARAELWILLLLSVAGEPLEIDILRVCVGRDDGTLGDCCRTLEQKGLVGHHEARWFVVHDEMGATTIELVGPDALHAANTTLGKALATVAVDSRSLMRAAPFLARADEGDRLRAVFARFVARQRREGDHRSNPSLARELLGNAASDTRVVSLVRSLPVHVRAGLGTPKRIITAAVVLALVPGGIVAAWNVLDRPPPVSPDAVLTLVKNEADGSRNLHRVPLFHDRWEPRRSLEVDLTAPPAWHIPPAALQQHFVLRPDGSGWLSSEMVSDSGVIDLVFVERNGRRRRLTWAPGDDGSGSWSPDGKFLVFTTGRASALSRYDVAVMEFATGETRLITSGDDTDLVPIWSPDGSRIAFARWYWTPRRFDLCTVTPNGRLLRCFELSRSAVVNPIGWRDTRRFLAVIRNNEAGVLVQIDVETGAADTLHTKALQVRTSPDGRWIVCECTEPGQDRASIIVAPIDRFGDYRPLRVTGADSGQFELTWGPGTAHSPYVHTLGVRRELGNPVVGIPHKLSLLATDSSGAPTPVGVITWRSSDTSIASIDSTGVMFAKRPGTIEIQSSAGGWRTASSTMSINEPRDSLLLDERWNRELSSAWVPFGKPKPMIVRDNTDAPAFLNNGEGSFASGAYTRARFEARAGLGIEAELSTPVTRDQWQLLALSLIRSPDFSPLDRWDHETGSISLPRATDCSFSYPAGREGEGFGSFIAMSSGNQAIDHPAPAWMANGRRYRVRVQLFPDGRCGVAIDGRVLSVEYAHAVEWPAIVQISGNSNGTQFLVGRMEVFAGVRTDVDWAAFERRRQP